MSGFIHRLSNVPALLRSFCVNRLPFSLLKSNRKSLRPVFDGRLPPPKFVSIETTKFCNLSCRMCIQYNEGSTKAGPHMDIDVFKQVAQSVFPFVERWQPSVSGEPTMSKGIYEMLEIAEKFGVKNEMYTNGTLLSDKMIDHLIPSLGVLTFSFDGPDKNTYETIRRGADYDEVVENIKKLIRRCEQVLPHDQLPQFGVNCTIMELNIRQLPDLVRFASEELKVDYIQANHVFPVTEEMKKLSLANYVKLAISCIEEALEVAEETGIALIVQPLDRVTASTAAVSGSERELATQDGHVAGLGYHEINQNKRRLAPRLSPSTPGYKEIMRRRRAALEKSSFPDSFNRNRYATKQDSIWYCDFLWNRTYVPMGGDVHVCCVYGAPQVGNIFKTRFDELWNNEIYRTLRQRMVLKDPAPACRGCMHIRELKDAVEIDYRLGGTRLPDIGDLSPLPPALEHTSGSGVV
jgi:MoaA/NifB/PqqE/SkfB family radical SAM enzyme